MDKQEIIALVRFCILMQNGKGILSKAPSYILKKFETKDHASLDAQNTKKLNEYMRTWGHHLQ